MINALVIRLGWTLLHFLWQGLVIAVLYAAVRRVMPRRASPHARYLLACTALAAMMAAPLVTWQWMGPRAAGAEATYRIQSSPPAPAADVERPAAVFAVSALEAAPAQFLTWVVMLWFAGAMVFWIRLAGGWVVAARMRSMLVRRAPSEWQESLGRLRARMGLSRPVPLLVSALVETPVVVGWLRPVVLVPVGALAGLPAEHVEALLLHELAHIRRHDYLVNLLQGVTEALLFYHPAVWWVSGHIRTERELCCDDLAVSVSGDVLTYARALTELESCRPALGSVMAANGPALPDRIARLLGQARPAAASRVGPGVVAAGILLMAAAYGLFGQADEHPAFEVASIKPSPATTVDRTKLSTGAGYRPGGRMTAGNMSLKLLIQFAYADHDSPHSLPLMASRVVGGPAWIDTELYDIEAKPAGNTDVRHAWLMMQTLLADRFRLALHRETRELPVYELRAAKGGLKLPPAKEIGCISYPPGTPPRHVPGKADCGYVPVLRESGAYRITGTKLRMADLVREMAFVLDRPVLDQTGFTGEFDINLRFTAEGVPWVFPLDAGPADPDVPNLFIALEEQLGLKLVPGKGPVDVLVVDRAERPTAN